MVFDIKSARDTNTMSCWNKTIWRVFIDGKLFISDDHKTEFPSKHEAETALINSRFWEIVEEYIDYSQRFFDKTNDNEWTNEFREKIKYNLNIEIKEYKCDD